MKIYFEFDLPEDNYEYKMYVRAGDMYCSLTDIADYLRSIRKEWINPSTEEMEERISEILNESKIYEVE